MSDYCKLFNRIWNDPDFIALEADPQRVYMMLLSYPTRDNAGVLPLTLRRWVKATNGMTAELFTAALTALAEARFIVIDWNTEEVLIRTFIKNDETYRQPNLWDNAVKTACKVQSKTIRWHIVKQVLDVIHSPAAEKWKPGTNNAVEALVNSIPEGLPEPITEGLTEGLPEPPGVGALRTRPNAPTPATAKAPTPAARDDDPTAPPRRGRSATPGAELVRRVIPATYPNAVHTELRLQANALLREGQPPEAVEAALALWLTKSGVGPRILPSLVADVLKGPVQQNPNRPKDKMRALAELTQQVLNHEIATGQKELTA